MDKKNIDKGMFIDQNKVDYILNSMPNKKDIEKLSVLFKAIADPTRLKILHALKETELCVCDIARLLDMTQSAISHQLRVLKHTNLVKSEKIGKAVIYSLDDNHVKYIFENGMQHISEEK